MNDAVYKFKRYEDASLTYTGVNKHENEGVGLYSTVLSRADYNSMAEQQQKSIISLQSEKAKAKNLRPYDIAVPKSMVEKMDAKYMSALQNVANNTLSDTELVKLGSKVIHKAFDEGFVEKIDAGIIYIDFNGMKKQFMFPEAFQQGFLKLKN